MAEPTTDGKIARELPPQDLGDLTTIKEAQSHSSLSDPPNQAPADDSGPPVNQPATDLGAEASSPASPSSVLADFGINKTKIQPPPPRVIHKKTLPLEKTPHGHTFRRHSTTVTQQSQSFDETKLWDQKLILSLDGGGIRGYSALLIIQALMEAIIHEERNWPAGPDPWDGPAESSYHPVDPTISLTTDSESADHLPHAVKQAGLWLPCHYFDYMAGTSTGGLIGIMLGRLRMTVDDCIKEYEELGHKVFGRSRWCHFRSPLWLPREKYSHDVLKQVVKDAVEERVPRIGTFPGGKNFMFDDTRCRVVCVSYQQQARGQAEVPYLFRTYQNLRKGKTKEDARIDRNPGPAHDIPIWEVARATSAAPSYFKEVEIEGRLYVDGGFGTNNPCREIFEEVRKLSNYNPLCTKTIISIGTGMQTTQRIQTKRRRTKIFLYDEFGKFIHYLNFARKSATDSGETHIDMLRQKKGLPNLKYERFDVDEGLDDMKLDEWKVRKPLRLYIGRQIGNIRAYRQRSSQSKNFEGREQEKASAKLSHAEGSPNGVDASNATPNPNSDSDTDAKDPASLIPLWFQEHNKTLEKIRVHTQKYLENEEIRKKIEECAQVLVESRRGRAKADPDRWERTCFGTWYQCNVEHCPRAEKRYDNDHAMEKHLMHKHPTFHSKKDDAAKASLQKALDDCKIVVQ